MSGFMDDARQTWRHAGLPCAIKDNRKGFINGYVQLPEEHVGRHVGYDQLNRTISVHGGLTFGVNSEGWVGFDTGHSGDYWPDMTKFLDEPVGRAWTVERLIAETNRLAEQLAAMTSLGEPESSWDCTEEEFAALQADARSWRALKAAEGVTA